MDTTCELYPSGTCKLYRRRPEYNLRVVLSTTCRLYLGLMGLMYGVDVRVDAASVRSLPTFQPSETSQGTRDRESHRK